MNNKYFLYALCVTLVVTVGSWASLFSEAGRSSGGGSSWSGSRGGYYGGSGYSGGGGGHK